MVVKVVGIQRGDGGTERSIVVDMGKLDELTTGQARELANTLIAAADELDRLSGRCGQDQTRFGSLRKSGVAR